jgi:hypothetical protein
MRYQHTQKVPTSTFAPITAVGILGGMLIPGGFLRLAAIGALGYAAATFRCLTVTVNKGEIVLNFGEGLFKKFIPLEKVQGCKAVRTTPINGWGVHWIGKGWLYNVYGLDAVELELADGGATLIGTDDAAQLVVAINEELESMQRAHADKT